MTYATIWICKACAGCYSPCVTCLVVVKEFSFVFVPLVVGDDVRRLVESNGLCAELVGHCVVCVPLKGGSGRSGAGHWPCAILLWLLLALLSGYCRSGCIACKVCFWQLSIELTCTLNPL